MIDVDTLRQLGWSDELIAEVRRVLSDSRLTDGLSETTRSLLMGIDSAAPLTVPVSSPTSAGGSSVLAEQAGIPRLTAT